jgi:hypothetical protein
VAVTESPRLSQKPKPYLSSSGSDKNNTSDGSTNQKIWLESAAICKGSAPSKCIQIIASNEVSGNAATSAATPLWRLAISEISTMTSAETKNFRM